MQQLKYFFLRVFLVIAIHITALQTLCYAQTPEEVRKNFIADSIKRKTDSLETDSIRGVKVNPALHTYSLARFQMAFWFTLTIVSFFFIWLITDAYDIITTTILALIGISAGTSLSATVIDDNKRTETLNQTITLQNEKTVLDNEILILNLQLKADPANIELQKQIKEKESLVNEKALQIARNITVLTPQKSEGFFNDILQDVNGVSFHRVQLLVWTLVLSLIFLHSVWKSLLMPEFSATLLALQGLTSGTYLGFKFPEKHA